MCELELELELEHFGRAQTRVFGSSSALIGLFYFRFFFFKKKKHILNEIKILLTVSSPKTITTKFIQ
jgi:hypothetical protein